MRLWTLHPTLLDARGLVALWREALLAQAVLGNKTRGYRYHPQLQRFRESPAPLAAVAVYLQGVHVEATRRGYRFDASRIGTVAGTPHPIETTQGQLDYEWAHLHEKLRLRDPQRLARYAAGKTIPQAHPLFRIVPGDVARWETGAKPKPEAQPRRTVPI